MKDTYRAKTIKKEKRGDVCCRREIAPEISEALEQLMSLANVQSMEGKEGAMVIEGNVHGTNLDVGFGEVLEQRDGGIGERMCP